MAYFLGHPVDNPVLFASLIECVQKVYSTIYLYLFRKHKNTAPWQSHRPTADRTVRPH